LLLTVCVKESLTRPCEKLAPIIPPVWTIGAVGTCYFKCEHGPWENQTFRPESHLGSDCAYRAKHLAKESGPSVHCEDGSLRIVNRNETINSPTWPREASLCRWEKQQPLGYRLRLLLARFGRDWAIILEKRKGGGCEIILTNLHICYQDCGGDNKQDVDCTKYQEGRKESNVLVNYYQVNK